MTTSYMDSVLWEQSYVAIWSDDYLSELGWAGNYRSEKYFEDNDGHVFNASAEGYIL